MTESHSLWGLRLLALALAGLVWFLVSVEGEEGTSVRVIDAPVRYDTPRDFAILDPVESVRLTIEGPTSRMRILNPFNVEVFVQPAAQKGALEVLLGPDNVLLPTEDLEVRSIEPNVLTLVLDRVTTELLPVVPRIEGEPAAGAIAQEPKVDPGVVLVRGPESRIRQVGKLTTSPVNLSGHALDFEEQAAVISPDPMIQILQPAVVTVRIPLRLRGSTSDGDGGSG